MAGGEDNPAKRSQSGSGGPADRILEEMLRQIGGEILDEPVPEKLRRVLRQKGGSDAKNTANDTRRRDARTQRRDNEPPG